MTAPTGQIPSVATFSRLGVQPQLDRAANPTLAARTWLRRDIIRGVWRPEARLKVDQLSRFYAIGHSPVREAILVLTPTGLIEHQPQRGYRVAPVSFADFQDTMRTYRRLYHMALDMALERANPVWEERVVLAQHRTSKVPKVMPGEDWEGREAWQLAYKSFHAELLAGCGSDILTTLMRSIGDRLERYVNLFGDLSSDRTRNQHAEHRAIVDALTGGDHAELRRLIDTYLGGGSPIGASIRAALAGPLPVPGPRRHATETAAKAESGRDGT